MKSWLHKQTDNNPKKLFIQQENISFTFKEIHDSVITFAKSLIREKISYQDKVIIFLPTGIDSVEIILACFEIGAIAVPISIKLKDPEIKTLLKLINPALIITNWENKHKVSIFNSYPIIYKEELISSASRCEFYKIINSTKSNDIAVILLTSGTTDLPKAVELTYNNFKSSSENWDNYLNFKYNDQFLCCLPLNHIGGLAVIIRALIFGFSVNLVIGFNAQVIFRTIKQHPITIISLVPTLLMRILKFSDANLWLKSLRYILLGGGPASDKLLFHCIENKINIIKTYGMTETCSGIVGLSILKERENHQYAGRPFKDVQLNVKNGTIQISGPMVMKGYLGETPLNGSHNSMDLGYIKNDLLFIECRRKDLIISGGENVNPREVESIIYNFPGIKDVAVTGIENEEW